MILYKNQKWRRKKWTIYNIKRASLKNNIKNLKSGINEVKKPEQEKQKLVKEVDEVQTKLKVALASIESAKKLNETYFERFNNLQSLYRSFKEKLLNK